MNNERAGVQSEKDGHNEEELDIDMFLALGRPTKYQSQTERQLENGILEGMREERELDRESGVQRWAAEEGWSLNMLD